VPAQTGAVIEVLGLAGGPLSQAGYHWLAELGPVQEDMVGPGPDSPVPPAPGGGDSGLAWAEGTLWVGQYRNRKIHQIDPQTGAILRTIESNRFVTGVTWILDRRQALARHLGR
jgi:hypothetical protein